MENILADDDKLNASAKTIVKNAVDKAKLLNTGLWFGGKRQTADTFTAISPDILCPIYCYWRHVTLNYPNTDKLRY